jgi:MoaA/NifB/PqqE/SkfB family radical SAM enzyme
MGKYSSKKETFIKDISKWQESRTEYLIKPISFTFEITNICNCNCVDCGMAANSIKIGKTRLNEEELLKLVDDLNNYGIPAYAITGGEPFLESENMFKMIKYAANKLDISKIISNGFWGYNAEYYFNKLDESGWLNSEFFIPSLQISIGEQTVPLDYVCNIINYVTTNYKMNLLHLGIIHTKYNEMKESKLSMLYNAYIKRFKEFPSGRVYLTNSNYYNANSKNNRKINVPKTSIYDAIKFCDNKFEIGIGKFINPKIFMKCNGDCYPCEVFNIHKDVFLGNYFKDGLPKILENLNTNKYINFIRKYGTVGFREVIPKKILKQNLCETPCLGCEFCIKFCEENNLIGDEYGKRYTKH